jgi:hypothetical protein
MGLPKIRKSTPAARKCAAIESPYGPAPTIATGLLRVLLEIISKGTQLVGETVYTVGRKILMAGQL